MKGEPQDEALRAARIAIGILREEVAAFTASRDEWRRRAEVLRDELKSVAATFAEGYPSWSDWREALTSPVLDVIDSMGEDREA